MTVPLLDLEVVHASLLPELGAAAVRVIRSNRFILGPELEAFEREVAGALGAAHAVGVSSGTDALLSSLTALGVGPGDEVIVPAYSFFATASTVARLGATPVFVDIEPSTYNIDPARVEAALTDRTRALMPVHLYGQTADMDPLLTLAARRGVPIVEDAAQAIFAGLPHARAGCRGDLGCFSFFPSKNLGGFGDAGLVVTRDADQAEQLRRLRHHGACDRDVHPELGGNFRMDALQAALLRVKLPHLAAWTEARRDNARRYHDLFEQAGLIGPDRISPPAERQPGHVYNQYVIRSPARDRIEAHLGKQGIGCAVYYRRPLHLQPCFAGLGHAPGDFPEAERAAAETLALPVYPGLSGAQQRQVVEAIAQALTL